MISDSANIPSVRVQKLRAKGKSALDKQIVWPRPSICPTFVTYKDFPASSSVYANCLYAQRKLPKLSSPRFAFAYTTNYCCAGSLFLSSSCYLLKPRKAQLTHAFGQG